MPLSVAAACSSRLNERQNFLRSARPHARLMRAPNGVCRISCIPPPSSKKRSATTCVSVGTAPSTALPARTYATACSAPARSRPHSRDQPLASRPRRRARRSPRAAPRLRARARSCGPRPSPFQNGIDGGAPCAFSTRTTPDSTRRILPRRRAEQEDVAGHALDREVFVDRADDVAVGFGDDVVVRRLGDRAARRDRGHARAAPRAQPAVDAVVMQKRAAAAARGRDAVGEHRDDVVEVFAREVAVRIRGAHQRVERVDVPIVVGRAGGDELLREDVERRARDGQRVHRAAADRAHERGALEQFVARRREQTAFGLRADPVARAADALQRDRDRARRAELHDEVDRADVDAEFERRGRDDGAQLARSSAGVRPRSDARARDCRDAAARRLRPAAAASANATRSLMRRVLTNTSVVRCARMSSAMRS